MRYATPFALLLGLMCISCGCIQATPGYDHTASQTPGTTPEHPAVAPTNTAPAAPAPTPEPEPFPYTLSVGEVFVYGDEEKGTQRELTVYHAELKQSYQFSHPDWGTNYGTAKPVSGMQFLFVFVRIVHAGTAKEAGAPHPASINVLFEGTSFGYRTDRVESVTDVLDYPGTDDYYGGIIHIYETREGFLIYEVPAGPTSEPWYVQVNLGNGLAPVWRIG
jgi:hypothetical protein